MFDNLALHDVTLEFIHFAWKDGQVVLHLSGHSASASTLTFDGVSELNVPRKLGWGPSVSINNVHTRHPGAFEIEMQTGDVISISATSWFFEPPGLSAHPEGAPWPSGDYFDLAFLAVTETMVETRTGLKLLYGEEAGMGKWAAICLRFASGSVVEIISYIDSANKGFTVRADLSCQPSIALADVSALFGLDRDDIPWIGARAPD